MTDHVPHIVPSRRDVEIAELEQEIDRLRAALTAIAEDNPNQVRTPTLLATIARQALAWKGSSNE
jgi:hypothetical protein